MKKIGIITQARVGSSRLPGKILLQVKNKSLLQYHLDRLKQTGYPVIVATSTLLQEEPILVICNQLSVPVVRGSETDVLSRFYEVWKRYQFDIMIRVTSDCPLIDPKLIQEGIEEYWTLQKNNPDHHVYYALGVAKTFARGFDFEIFDSKMLQEAFEVDNSAAGREHVTPYFYQNKSSRIKAFYKTQQVNHSHLRLTVDQPADFDLIKKLIEDYGADHLRQIQIEQLLMDHPELQNINAMVEQKKI